MTTFMNLTLPTVSTTIGPQWATELNAAITTIDSHDHSSGKGTPVPTSGININANLSFNNKNLTDVGAITYNNLSSVISDLNSLYVLSGDLYFNDASGSNIRITAAGAINVSSVGGIGGDYATTAATVYYTDSTKKYTFEDSTSANATIIVGAVEATSITASGASTLSGALTVTGAAIVTGTTTVSGAMTVTGDASFTGNTTGRGILPVGAILPLMSNLTGITDVTATTAADANGFVVCGGQTISDASSPMNGEVIPNINNDVFLMGSGTAGTTGGANSVTLTATEMPAHAHTINHGHSDTFALSSATFASGSHTHDMSHTHQWAHWDNTAEEFYTKVASDTASTSISSADSAWFSTATTTSGTLDIFKTPYTTNTNTFTTGVIDAPTGSGSSAVTGASTGTNTVTLSGAVTSHSGNSGSVGSGTSYNNRPSYLTAKYIMRIE